MNLQKKLPIIIDCLKSGYKPEKIYLFGSMTDLNKKSNDIDLLLIKKTTVKRLSERARQANRFLRSYDTPVDFLVYTPEEVEYELKRGNIFLAEILEKGKLLYEEKV